MYRIGDAREPVPTVVDAGLAAAKKRPTQFGRFSDPNRSIFGVRLAELARTFHSGGALIFLAAACIPTTSLPPLGVVTGATHRRRVLFGGKPWERVAKTLGLRPSFRIQVPNHSQSGRCRIP